MFSGEGDGARISLFVFVPSGNWSRLAERPEEVVEVVMSQEARDLYAEKKPEAVKKHQQQLATSALSSSSSLQSVASVNCVTPLVCVCKSEENASGVLCRRLGN